MRFRRKGGRKRLVRWLPDKSWASVVSGKGSGTVTPGNPFVITDEQALLLSVGAGDGVPEALASTSFGSGRMESDCLILDHISGQIHWGIEGNDGVHADAAGNWSMWVGAAIWIGGGTTTAAGAAGTETLNAISTQTAGLFNPSFDPHTMQQGSFVGDGVRVLWRRSWFMTAGFSNSRPMPALCSSFATPPSGYVDIKPKRILRPNEKLMSGIVWYVFPSTGSSGSALIRWTPDLRVAAHNTTRRR